MTEAQKLRSFKRWIVVVTVVGLLLAGAHWSVQIRCLFYPECNPLMSVPEMPRWNVPTGPQEREAYDYAHSLKVPEGAPKPVPFDFKAARLAALAGGESVAQQYFEHLCRTEDSETIVRRVQNVDGFLLMRPRGQNQDTRANADRYGTEEPVGFGWFGDDNQFAYQSVDFLGDSYVQPLYGVYHFVEFVQPSDPTKVVRVARAPQGDTKRFPYGVSAGWRGKVVGIFNAPYLVTRITANHVSARYAYTWRGLHRPRDREFGIAGGEFFIVDRQTNDVLAMKRTFKSAYLPYKPSHTNWVAARGCRQLRLSPPIPYFIEKVLAPDMHVNDTFVPAVELDNYHQFLKKRIEKNYAD